MNQDIVSRTENFVRLFYSDKESGHDMHHIERVMKNAIQIARTEPQANLLVVKLAVFLHDMADSKLNEESEGLRAIETFLSEQQADKRTIDEVMYIIKNMSFKHSFGNEINKSIEFQIVQDADRLDAIGAMGIARAFSYGGHKKRPFYDESEPQRFTSTETYTKAESSTINHFYEKLLLLKDMMNTRKGKELAEERHRFMLAFLKQFDAERNGLL